MPAIDPASTPDPALFDIQQLLEKISRSDRRAVARAITLVESNLPMHRKLAGDLLTRLPVDNQHSLRIGITGVPGVGKSTFIEALGNQVLDQGHRVAVLSIDPSSSLTGGSILGDKTRMEHLSRRDNAFIRPSPSAGSLGGVARRTRETVSILEAAGFDVILIETVGVGQSETLVAQMTDMFVLLLLPGGGDELQGIKRGIMELADLIVVNKADGAQKVLAERDVAEFRHALRLLKPRRREWKVPVVSCSALNQTGIDTTWGKIASFFDVLRESGELESQRRRQRQAWFMDEIKNGLLESLDSDPHMHRMLNDFSQQVLDAELPPTIAALELVQQFLHQKETHLDR